jgi:tyrosinase
MPQMGMVGRNFLAWHRRFLWQFEQRLRQIDGTLSVPYWDWIADPTIPQPLALSATQLQQRWSVTRHWDSSHMPTKPELDAVVARPGFAQFQRRLELGPHADVHVAIGGSNGTMDSASSPADPIFWLHHANLDRIWVDWSSHHATAKPSHLNEILQPASLFGVKVSAVLDIATLGYSYA